ncbi:hypothetical protein RvY_07816-2 [Ramazzottius varieornatus]|uniref:PH domain-containing protein n=1 Tax=Ramazzottius varieornatus TaxID=947166 RepID=A0A1D1VCX5_RAMVA|nr:hypothetical protein RvY_07816-2 [Ramazzottius varieornatus]
MHPLLLRVLQYNDLSIAGDLFSVSDADIVKDLLEVCPVLESLITDPLYLSNANSQSVVEICVCRVLSAVRGTVSVGKNVAHLLRLLNRCLQFDLTTQSNGQDSPHAKIASDIINCIFRTYDQKDVMEAALPTGLRFLTCDNRDLSRKMSCYVSLIVIHQPFLASLYVADFVRAILKGNLQLTTVLSHLYNLNPKPVMDHIGDLVQLLPNCGDNEKEHLLNTCNLIVQDHPQEVWPVVGTLVDVMSDPKCETTVLRIFSTIARHSAVPFLTHLRKIKLMVDNNPTSLSAASGIFGAVGKLGEAPAKDCLQYMISRSILIDSSQVPYLIHEIRTLLNLYPHLTEDVNLLLAKNSAGGNANIEAISSALKNPEDLHLSSRFLNEQDLSYAGFMNEPPPYPTSRDEPLWDSGSRSYLPLLSPSAARYHGLGKSSVEVRQISTATSKNRPHFYGSTNYVPPNRNVANGRGSIGSIAAAKTSQHSLHSRNNSRQSLSSSGLLSAANKRPSRGNVLGSSELNGKAHVIPSLSPIYSRTEGQIYGHTGNAPDSLSTFVVENSILSKSNEAISVRSRRSASRHSLVPRPRSRIVDAADQPQVIQVVPIHDAVYQFCDRNLDKIRKYMAGVFVQFPLPVRCGIEEHKGRKHCNLFFACQCRGDQCLYAARMFSFVTEIPKVWIHLMFLAIQAKSSTALNQQDSAVHGLKLCWDSLGTRKDFATLVTSAFPSSSMQDALLRELSNARYFDIFEYNASIKQWGCFLCNYPEKAHAMFTNGVPLMEGTLKEKKGRWAFLKRWKTRHFTLSGPFLTYKVLCSNT